jgi:hypothetical protein
MCTGIKCLLFNSIICLHFPQYLQFSHFTPQKIVIKILQNISEGTDQKSKLFNNLASVQSDYFIK